MRHILTNDADASAMGAYFWELMNVNSELNKNREFVVIFI